MKLYIYSLSLKNFWKALKGLKYNKQNGVGGVLLVLAVTLD